MSTTEPKVHTITEGGGGGYRSASGPFPLLRIETQTRFPAWRHDAIAASGPPPSAPISAVASAMSPKRPPLRAAGGSVTALARHAQRGWLLPCHVRCLLVLNLLSPCILRFNRLLDRLATRLLFGYHNLALFAHIEVRILAQPTQWPLPEVIVPAPPTKSSLDQISPRRPARSREPLRGGGTGARRALAAARAPACPAPPRDRSRARRR